MTPEDELEIEEGRVTRKVAVEYLSSLIHDDDVIGGYGHLIALERSYGGTTEDHEGWFQHDAEHDDSNAKQQLYWGTRTSVVQSLLGEVIAQAHHWTEPK